MKAQIERQLQNEFVKYINSTSQCVALVFDNKGSFDPTKGIFKKTIGRTLGVSDLILLFPKGKTIFVEVKTPRIGTSAKEGQLSKHQIEFKRKVEDLGFDYYIAKTLDDIKCILLKYE